MLNIEEVALEIIAERATNNQPAAPPENLTEIFLDATYTLMRRLGVRACDLNVDEMRVHISPKIQRAYAHWESIGEATVN